MANSIHSRHPLTTPSPWMERARHSATDSTDLSVVVDMTTVSRVCSEDLNEVIRLHLELKTQGRRLVLANIPDHVREVFLITRLDRVIEIRGESVTA